jgi:hypothetical protein
LYEQDIPALKFILQEYFIFVKCLNMKKALIAQGFVTINSQSRKGRISNKEKITIIARRAGVARSYLSHPPMGEFPRGNAVASPPT